MVKLKYKYVGQYEKDAYWTNPRCGHEQVFQYATPYKCQVPGCLEHLEQVDRLIGVGDKNQDVRVKYYVEGKV